MGKRDTSKTFQQQASEKRVGFFTEYVHFLRSNKKWWLVPLLVVLLGLGVLVVLGSTGAAPFLYTLF
jgi:hypothetical protein